jgi:diguanylate cyclase (GGDEF)-like protein
MGLVFIVYSFYSLGKSGGLAYGLIYCVVSMYMIFSGPSAQWTSYMFDIVFSAILLFYLSHFIDAIDEKEKSNEIVNMEMDTDTIMSDEKIKKIIGAIEAKKSKIENYRMLTKVAEELLSTLDKRDIVKVIVGYLPKLTGKQNVKCMLLVKHEETDTFIQTTEEHSEDQLVKGAPGVYKKDPFDEWVIKNKYTLFIKNVDDDLRFRNLRKDWILFKSLISMPLFENKRLIGILKFYSKEAETFDNEDVRLLNYLGDISSSVVENSILYKKTEALATQDGLTGLFIRRYFIERLDEEIKRAKTTDSSFSYVMIDIDHFKDCNDTYGHLFGDTVLRFLGGFLKDDLRDVDVAGRYGGEEFAIILPNTNMNGAKFVADRLRENFSKLVIAVNENEGMKLTLSMGGVEYKKGMKVMDVMNQADKALYYSKENGRNKVTFWEEIVNET